MGSPSFKSCGADCDHLFPELHSHNSNGALIGRSQLHFAKTCRPLAGPFLRYHHRESAGFRWIWNDGAEWH